jgi:chemotaxis protein methyltransferase CheR
MIAPPGRPPPDPSQAVASLLKRRTGVQIAPGREDLIQSRLAPLLRQEGLTDLGQLVAALERAEAAERARGPTLIDQVVDLLTTHETSFFRDPPVFQWLRQRAIPRILAGRDPRQPLRVWSAACSTGQEALSVAMSVLEDHPAQALEVVGTDISALTVAEATAATYSVLAVNRGLPARALLRWFERDGAGWRATPPLRAVTRFAVGNLVTDRPPGAGFDIVLLRNVLIYFDDADRQRALDAVATALRPGGLLILGTAEGLMPINGSILRAEREDMIGYRVRV